MNQQNILLIFHEEWLSIPTLSNFHGEKLTEEIQKMEKMSNQLCKNCTLKNIKEKYVPIKEVRETIVRICNSIHVSIDWNEYVNDFNYFPQDKKKFKYLGYFLIRIQLLKENGAVGEEKTEKDNHNYIKKSDIRPKHLQQIIMLLWNELKKKFSDRFLFDENTVPYAITVCSGLENSQEINWYQDTIVENKEEVGKWVELYSGQFPDYHDKLYEQRIKTNLSNRTSEMHFINRNSGLIYMKPENYDYFFIKEKRTENSTGYMYNQVLKTIFQIKTIAFAMILVNKEIDYDTQQLTMKQFIEKKSTEIKADLDKTKRLKMVLQRILAPFWTDLSQSHRQHYHTVLKHTVEINDIEKNWERITVKLESNTEELNSIFLDKQEEASKRQDHKLNWVNSLLGASIVFEIMGYIIDNQTMLGILMKIFGWTFIVLLVVLLGISVFPKIFNKRKRKNQSN